MKIFSLFSLWTACAVYAVVCWSDRCGVDRNSVYHMVLETGSDSRQVKDVVIVWNA